MIIMITMKIKSIKTRMQTTEFSSIFGGSIQYRIPNSRVSLSAEFDRINVHYIKRH